MTSDEFLKGLQTVMPIVALGAGWAVTWSSLSSTIQVVQQRVIWQDEQLKELRLDVKALKTSIDKVYYQGSNVYSRQIQPNSKP